MRGLFQFFRNLIKADSAESSKRFLALFAGVVLVSYIVFAFTRSANAEVILGEVLGFVLVLAGVASWQDVKKRNNEK